MATKTKAPKRKAAKAPRPAAQDLTHFWGEFDDDGHAEAFRGAVFSTCKAQIFRRIEFIALETPERFSVGWTGWRQSWPPSGPLAVPKHAGHLFSGYDDGPFVSREEALARVAANNRAIIDQSVLGREPRDYEECCWTMLLEFGQPVGVPVCCIHNMEEPGIGMLTVTQSQPFRLVHPTPAEIAALT